MQINFCSRSGQTVAIAIKSAMFHPIREKKEPCNRNGCRVSSICWLILMSGELAVHGSSPLTPQSQKAFETAVKLNIPVIIHTGNGVPCALPSLAIPVAKAYPELSMVLAHSGAGMYGAEALIAAQQCPNITLEPSLTTVMDIPSFIRKLGAEPVMFGTDIPLNASAELGKYKALHLTEEPYAWVHEGTARRVFRL